MAPNVFNQITENQRVNSIDLEMIDSAICEAIDELTQENHSIWSSPDHDRREYVHSFFQYPAMMVPVVQKKIIEIIVDCKGDVENVLDSFMGSGTSLVASMENGLNVYGQDVNPLSVLVTKTRTGPFCFEDIDKKKKMFFLTFENDNSVTIEVNFKGLYKWFKLDVAEELSKLVRAIRLEENITIRRFYWVILAETVRLTSNDRTSTFKLHARPIDEITGRALSPIDIFKKHFQKCLADLKEYQDLLSKAGKLYDGRYEGECVLNLLDTKSKIFVPENETTFFDLHVTSPPYGDNKTTVTYGQYSYLPLQWIDLKDITDNISDDILSTTSYIDSLGLGGKIRKYEEEELDVLFNASPTLMEIYNSILTKDADKSKKVISFFYDIYLSIKNIHSAMRMNGYQVWTVGNRTVAGIVIPNNKIMMEFIISHGSILVKTINREILNRRMAKRNRSGELMIFEDILIFRKIG